MAEQGPLGLYKCKRQSQAQSPSDDRRQHQPKKQKLSHPTRPPPFFWDSLPGVPLTENALHELDRRNRERARSARSLSRKPARGPVTRRAAAEPLPRCVPVDPERIRSFARQGGPDLSDLRGSTGPYDGAFQQHLVDYGIYPDQYEYPNGRIPPELGNMDEIARFLAQPRPSLSPTRCSNDDFRKFKRADAHAAKERQGTAFVVPIISGDVGDSRCVAGEIPFTNLDHLTNGSLFPGNPDLYHGARPEQLDRKVRAELEGRIIPSTQQDLPIAPNFFLAVKGPNRSLAVAQRQACYDGALGARGMQDLLYGEPEPVHDNNAYTMTCFY